MVNARFGGGGGGREEGGGGYKGEGEEGEKVEWALWKFLYERRVALNHHWGFILIACKQSFQFQSNIPSRLSIASIWILINRTPSLISEPLHWLVDRCAGGH